MQGRQQVWKGGPTWLTAHLTSQCEARHCVTEESESRFLLLVAQPCVLRFLVCTTSRRYEHAGNVSEKKKNDPKAVLGRFLYFYEGQAAAM